MTDLYKQTACEVVAKLKSGEVSIQDTLNAVESRIQEVDGQLNSLPTMCFDRAASKGIALQALPVERRGELCGLPVAIKDLTNVEGVRTTMGSAVFKDHIPKESDQLVTRIEANGGVVYAKSNTPEFGAGGITFNGVFSDTRTPYNTVMSSGGSSGGAASSLASGCAWLSHGSDMAGSLRTPASFCGVASLRPSPGTMRSDSAYLPFDVLGADGPMARDIQDLALFSDTMRNENSHAMQSAVASSNETKLSDLRVAVSTNLGVTEVSDDIANVFEQFVADALKDCKRVSEKHPDLSGVHESFDALRANFYATALEPIFEDNRQLMKPEVIWNVEQGFAQTSQQYREALRVQGRMVSSAAKFMEDTDVLICPATSLVSVAADVRYPGEPEGVPVPEYYRWLAIAYATTMTTLPIITLPLATMVNGMPIAVQLIGKPWGEAALFQVAYQLEQVIGRNSSPIDPV